VVAVEEVVILAAPASPELGLIIIWDFALFAAAMDTALQVRALAQNMGIQSYLHNQQMLREFLCLAKMTLTWAFAVSHAVMGTAPGAPVNLFD
jgi:poly(3-hydroxyalkanoate) synthetase